MAKHVTYGPQEDFSVFEDTMVEMTWEEIRAEADQNAVVLLPVGIVEAHGPHLDLSADFYLSTFNCRCLKQALDEKGIKSLIAPPLYWGVGVDTAKYAGTFSVRPETMKALLTDVFASLKSWGFRRVFVTNAHGDHLHLDTIRQAVAQADDKPDFRVYFMWDLDIKVDTVVAYPPQREDRYQPDYHAGAIETAQMAAFFPGKLRRDIAKTLKPQDGFDPRAYCGDPANYGKEINMEAFMETDVKIDTMKIEAILRRDGK